VIRFRALASEYFDIHDFTVAFIEINEEGTANRGISQIKSVIGLTAQATCPLKQSSANSCQLQLLFVPLVLDRRWGRDSSGNFATHPAAEHGFQHNE